MVKIGNFEMGLNLHMGTIQVLIEYKPHDRQYNVQIDYSDRRYANLKTDTNVCVYACFVLYMYIYV